MNQNMGSEWFEFPARDRRGWPIYTITAWRRACASHLSLNLGHGWARSLLCCSPTSERWLYTGNNFRTNMAPPPAKRARKVLTLEMKREILRRCHEGWSSAHIQEEFGIPKSSLGDLKKAREKIAAYTDDFSAASKTSKRKDRKTTAKPKNVELDQCVIKWHQQQHASGVMVHGTELKMAAERFASNIRLQGLTPSIR
ncbi:Tigger transposable element-derived protein 2 [Portunus trituberculatus]|uniref:Tigger transposable element-derived protein 2 n=1 Tax=Portunus trituberculatus TaxID=210409 RepID=A0A5B7FM53_PORTR|nr:Tigger transposable element-derived protein 2 [Portunus trituberculatus]